MDKNFDLIKVIPGHEILGESFLEAITEWVMFLDNQGLIIYSNRQVETFTGLKREEILGLSFEPMIEELTQMPFAVLDTLPDLSSEFFYCGEHIFKYLNIKVNIFINRQSSWFGEIYRVICSQAPVISWGTLKEKKIVNETYARASQFVTSNILWHQLRTAKIAAAVAKHLSMEKNLIEQISRAAEFHDVGKLSNLALYQKTSTFTTREFYLMREHPNLSCQMVSHICDPNSLILQIIATHHERLDGSGYPRGLKAENLPLYCRILPIADSFEAATAKRPYKKSKSIEDVLREIYSMRSTKYDATAVEALIDLHKCVPQCLSAFM